MPWSYWEIRRHIPCFQSSGFPTTRGKIVQNGVDPPPTVIVVIPHNLVGTTKQKKYYNSPTTFSGHGVFQLRSHMDKSALAMGKCRETLVTYQQHVSCGGSIGPGSPTGEWVGSLGGCLRNKMNGDVYGITCSRGLRRYPADLRRPVEKLFELLPWEQQWSNPHYSNTGF